MKLAEDIRTLRDRSLDGAYEYSLHTIHLWRFTQLSTVKKHFRFVIRDRKKGTKISERELASRAQHYVIEYLLPQTFQQFVSQFEVFYFDLLRIWLDHYPGSLGTRQVEFGAILSATDLADIRRSVIDKKLNEVKYESVSDWFDYFANLGVPALESQEIERIAEIKASRDILAHNNAIVNETYLQKAGKLARYREGERLEVTQQYHRESWEHITDVVRTIASAAHEKAGG